MFKNSLPSDAVYALRALQLNGKEAPTEFPLLMPGTWKGYVRDGKQLTFTVTPEDLRAAYEFHHERKKRNPERDLVLDYEHQTLTGGEAPAAAWFDLVLRDDVLYATNVRWTERGKSRVEAGEYRYVSPVFKHNAADKVTGKIYRMAVWNAALTNEAFLDELPPLIAKDIDLQLFILNSNNNQKKGDPMNPVMQFLLSFFALTAGTTEDTVVAKSREFFGKFKELGIALKDDASLTADAFFTALKGKFDELNKFKENYLIVAKALGETDENVLPEKLTALIAAKADTSQYVLKSEYTALKQRLDEREVDELITGAKAKGKISPATEPMYRALALKDRQSFIELMAKTPEYSVVPLKAIDVKTPGQSGELSEADLQIAKALGKDGDQNYLTALKATAKSLQN